MKAQCKGGVIAGSRRMSSLIVAAGERRGSLGVGFENMMRSWVMIYGAQRLGVVASRWLGDGKAKAQGRKWGEGSLLAITAMFCSEFACVFRLSVSMRKVARKHLLCVLIYMNSYMTHLFRFTYFPVKHISNI